MTLTLSWQKGNIGSAQPLVEVNIWAKIKENLSISVGLTLLQSGHDIMSNIWLFDIWPLIVTLSWHKRNMGYVYPLDQVNIAAKFEENPSIGRGFIERKR